MWYASLLGVMFRSKRSVCSFNTCLIFRPLIIFRHSILQTQIMSKASLCIFHDANHYKKIKMIRNKWIAAIWTSISFNGNLWISDGHFPMSRHNKNIDIQYGVICLLCHWKSVILGFGASSQKLFPIFKGFPYMLHEGL